MPDVEPHIRSTKLRFRRRFWSDAEDCALIEALQVYRKGHPSRWAAICRDSRFQQALQHRSCADIQDRARNPTFARIMAERCDATVRFDDAVPGSEDAASFQRASTEYSPVVSVVESILSSDDSGSSWSSASSPFCLSEDLDAMESSEPCHQVHWGTPVEAAHSTSIWTPAALGARRILGPINAEQHRVLTPSSVSTNVKVCSNETPEYKKARSRADNAAYMAIKPCSLYAQHRNKENIPSNVLRHDEIDLLLGCGSKESACKSSTHDKELRDRITKMDVCSLASIDSKVQFLCSLRMVTYRLRSKKSIEIAKAVALLERTQLRAWITAIRQTLVCNSDSSSGAVCCKVLRDILGAMQQNRSSFEEPQQMLPPSVARELIAVACLCDKRDVQPPCKPTEMVRRVLDTVQPMLLKNIEKVPQHIELCADIASAASTPVAN